MGNSHFTVQEEIRKYTHRFYAKENTSRSKKKTTPRLITSAENIQHCQVFKCFCMLGDFRVKEIEKCKQDFGFLDY